ncbi:hypothetical protein TSUD_151420 [Trifolium subterraneum]|uniref:Uncharacterized protein n=1 Tax=Trifolium subterraneum TaxID=3900 RepID=A0A2Z6NKA9_TRISU|nr:hypothetical protein TSUD_151420 [Trifolium subterraneum]
MQAIAHWWSCSIDQFRSKAPNGGARIGLQCKFLWGGNEDNNKILLHRNCGIRNGEWAGRIWSWKVNSDVCRSAAAGIGSAHRQCG